MLPNCTVTFISLTPMTTTTTTAAAAAAFKYYHHSLITLSHPLRLRPLLLQTPATRSSSLPQPTEHTFPSNEGNFTHTTIPTQLAILLFSNLPPLLFKLPALFFKLPAHRGRGGRSRDQGSGGGNFTLEKIFTSPCLHLTGYYCRRHVYHETTCINT